MSTFIYTIVILVILALALIGLWELGQEEAKEDEHESNFKDRTG